MTLTNLKAEELEEKQKTMPNLEEKRMKQHEGEERMTSFLEYLRNDAIFDGDCLRLPDGLVLGGDATLKHLRAGLYIRQCYANLCELIFELARVGTFEDKSFQVKRFALLGNPGIGKSMFSYFLLYRLMKLRKTIVWQPAGDKLRILISSSDRIRFSNFSDDFHDHLGCEATWFIIDADRPPLVAAFTVLISSPKEDLIHRFCKTANSLYMPVWSEEEIECAHALGLGCSAKNGKEVTIEQAKNTFKKFGGIPRYVFENGTDLAILEKQLKNSITSADFRLLQQAISEARNPGGSLNSFGHMVVQIRVDTETGPRRYISFTLRFASDHVEEQFMLHMLDSRERDFYKFLNDAATLEDFATIRGIAFKGLVHRLFARGDTFEVGKLQENTPPSDVEKITLEPSESMGFADLTELTVSDKKRYWKPSVRNFPGIDSLMLPDFLFQITVFNDHPVNRTAIENAARTLRNLQKKKPPQRKNDPPCVIRLFFVVPKEFNRYRKQNFTDGEGRVTCGIDGAGLRVEQYVLGVSLVGP